MFICLIVIFLAIDIVCGVVLATGSEPIAVEELLYDIYECSYEYERNVQNMIIIGWILTIKWEVLALWLVIWITVKRFRALRGSLTGWTVGGCFNQDHLLYPQCMLVP
ncbi:hypothetical protein CY34DRAFT_19393 [Suillus luteus UH-Slu-Lm8-n1]|uniref:Chitin synthase export chaperone n=1 Tax=Suillus luteus UH-Slu-Lm8-n1 TaxID=930992 RepID=A0A0D0AJ60_9AGAM|nr:hypothetical protein CY34DRAFT_19393 [Suillus luteus UH-Slu-Lm8-n1]